jgi:hypothetical protein
MAEDVGQLRERVEALEQQLAAARGDRFEKPAADLRAELAALAKKHNVRIQFTAVEVASGQVVPGGQRCICFA